MKEREIEFPKEVFILLVLQIFSYYEAVHSMSSASGGISFTLLAATFLPYLPAVFLIVLLFMRKRGALLLTAIALFQCLSITLNFREFLELIRDTSQTAEFADYCMLLFPVISSVILIIWAAVLLLTKDDAGAPFFRRTWYLPAVPYLFSILVFLPLLFSASEKGSEAWVELIVLILELAENLLFGKWLAFPYEEEKE